MKVRPAELHRFLLPPDRQAPLPLDWNEVFGRRAPLAVEVGFGNGEYLAWWSAQRSDWNFIGIEKPQDCLVRAARRMTLSERENVRLIRGDARFLLGELFEPASLEQVTMLFPMPWPKSRHAKHRVARSEFVGTLASVLKPEGRFELVTDQRWYAEDAERAFGAHAGFRVLPIEDEPERAFRTRYESRWLAEGRSIHRLVAVLKEGASRTRTCLPGEMLIQRLASFPADETLQALVGRRFVDGDRVAEIKEAFHNADGCLFKVLCADDSFSQIFYLRIARLSEGRGLVKVEDGLRPYFTQAVKLLIESVGSELQPVASS